MSQEVENIIKILDGKMDKAIDHLHHELQNIRAGKANPTMLESVKIDYYGTDTPIHQVANINATDGKTLSIQPWEKAMLEPICQSIMHANLGLNPQNNGEMIIISIPTLTEERRKELSKKAHSEGEIAKVSLRTSRKDAMEAIKDSQKNGLSEDIAKTYVAKIEVEIKKYYEKVDALVKAKDKDILTV